MSVESRAAAQVYRERVVDGASPVKIVRLLLERALRGIDCAAAADAGDPRSPFVAELCRANEIVIELRLAIDPAPAPELSAVTDGLYQFVNDQIHLALARRDAEPARAARPVLAKLHEAWCQLEQGTA
jgi:flagellar biosynthetic protein FliS